MSNPLALEFISRRIVLAMVVSGLFGMLFVFMLIEFDHQTSTEAFCTSCHSMELVAQPYRESAHYNSPSGIRASCGDCHVSEGLIAATLDHIIGARDLYKQIFGPEYDNPVVNLLHMPEASFSTRDWFRERDSATCRKCHTQKIISGRRADTLEIHNEGAEGKTCIDCHYNLVHRKVPDKQVFKRDAWNLMVEQEFGLEPGTAEQIHQGKIPPPAIKQEN
ncbi:MAG: NapC/NirT family cytochrome c [Gammaproteobacteria bacterium SHHR-1]|uniref:NapC/NirT family cytochrome c n=1 Tax=Magnetovirga frankeli TaxID=947516 RepID=UPI0012938D23|nr:NapC/NirT family cytochrome c [gamma proteobacterium SS-5]